MTKRLQVLLPDTQLRDIQRLARRQHLTTAEWVRRAIRTAHDAQSGRTAADKLAAIRRASSNAFPTGDIGQLNDEIEQGYLEDLP